MNFSFLSSTEWWLMALVSYAVCAMPFGLIITKVFLGYDVREQGSRNIGMTNVMRTGGKLPGIFTFLLDFSKSGVMLFISEYGIQDIGSDGITAIAFICVFAHTTSVYLGFKGGKGVATNFGAWLAIDWRISLVAMICWLTIYKIFKISSIGGIASLLVIIVLSFIFHGIGSYFVLSIILGLYITALHYDNIKRLLTGEELKMKKEN